MRIPAPTGGLLPALSLLWLAALHPVPPFTEDVTRHGKQAHLGPPTTGSEGGQRAGEHCQPQECWPAPPAAPCPRALGRSGLGLEERPVCGRDYSLGGCLELCCCVIYPCCSCLAVRTLRAPCLCLSKPRSLSHRLSKNSWCWGYPYPRPLPPALSIHPPRKPRAYV